MKLFNLLALSFFLAFSSSAQALSNSFLEVVPPLPTVEVYNSVDNTSRGYFFIPQTDMSVTALGHFDIAQYPLLGSSLVGIFNNSGTLLGSVTVSTSDTLIDSYHYANLSSPIILTAGQTYYIAGTSVINQHFYPFFINTTDPTINIHGIDITARGGNNNPGLLYANTTNTFASFNNVTAMFTVIGTPEPSTYLAMGSLLGICMLLVAYKRKVRQRA